VPVYHRPLEHSPARPVIMVNTVARNLNFTTFESCAVYLKIIGLEEASRKSSKIKLFEN